MGPRLFRRGDENGDFVVIVNQGQLQWGHVFSDVETAFWAKLSAGLYPFAESERAE
jgi:hypothetical protein